VERATELAAPDDERAGEQPLALEVGDEGRRRLVCTARTPRSTSRLAISALWANVPGVAAPGP
jgi:hypothetical protein